MEQPEAKLKKALVAGFSTAFGKAGWFNYMTAARKMGIPDLTFAWGRTPIWIEGKVDTPVSKIQAVVFSRMVYAGVAIYVVRWDHHSRALPKKLRQAWVHPWTSEGQGASGSLFSWSLFDHAHFWNTAFGGRS